jgi:FKBP-type peptidyl-prolyl cis-trans isomerase
MHSAVPFSSSRRETLAALIGGAALLANGKFANAIAGPEGLEYEVLKAGKGPKPKVGDLVAIRFKVDTNIFSWGHICI